MGLFLEAAQAWKNLHDVRYVLFVARKGEVKRIELTFLDEDFPHLAGMQYAKDVDFGVRPAEYYGNRLIPMLLHKRMNDGKIEKSKNWNRIEGRLTAIIHLQNTLDDDFVIVAFNNNKVKGYSQIVAEYAIKSMVSDDVYFVFLDQQSGRYYCKSAFRKEATDYTENQTRMTLLQKIKITQDREDILYKKDGYEPKGE